MGEIDIRDKARMNLTAVQAVGTTAKRQAQAEMAAYLDMFNPEMPKADRLRLIHNAGDPNG